MNKKMTKAEAEKLFLSGDTFFIGSVNTIRRDWLDELIAKYGKVCVVNEWGSDATLTQEVCYRGR